MTIDELSMCNAPLCFVDECAGVNTYIIARLIELFVKLLTIISNGLAFFNKKNHQEDQVVV